MFYSFDQLNRQNASFIEYYCQTQILITRFGLTMMPRIIFCILLLPSLLSAEIVRDGIADLREIDFENSSPIALVGAWEFYPSEFISPAASSQFTAKNSITVPKRWEESGYARMGFGTYRITIIRTSSGRLAIRIPDIFSAYKLYVNNELIAQVGEPATTAELSKSGRKVKLASLAHFNSDTLRLTMHVSNFMHSKGGIGDPILIGDQHHVFSKKLREDAADVFLTGGLVVSTFFFLGLYIFGRHERMAFCFALFCIVYAYRIIGWGNYVLHDLIEMPYRLGIFLEFATLYLSGYFFANYIQSLYPEDTPKHLVKLFAYFSLAFVLLAFLPVHYIGRLNYIYVYGALLGLGLVCYIIIKALVRKRQGSLFTALSIGGILIVFSMKTLDFLDIADEIKFVTLGGQFVFFFFQAMVLSRHFSDTWKAAKTKAEIASQAKSDFVSVMSHEIRTPLNAVIGTTHHLIEANKNPEYQEDLNNLKRSSENLLSLINNVLDFSKIESGKIELEKSATNLREFCAHTLEAMKPLADQKGIDLILVYEDTLPKRVEFDKVRLGQVITNLLGNAIKFTEKGHVKLVVNELTRKGDTARVYFAVEDTGIGLAEHVKDSVFEAFNQANNSVSRKFGGTGLGLTITKKLVELMKSRIFVDSEPGKGATFSFALTMEICDTHEEVEFHPEVPKDISGHHVLLSRR